ncbi:hypothetical protein TWF718_008816 [Orbilia javanica]|uniref:F-box domain-containing protein n=1 Tax=Orbilia javanica TaxID=47235 RepID=A0AAN8RC26_9PEZI
MHPPTKNMAPITSLPTEILLEVFKDTGLTATDLCRCSSTCRKFRDIAGLTNFTVDYVFKVDHTSQSGWKLIRCLLLNPKLGERIRSLQLSWHRRRRRDDTTWTLKWDWTEEELAGIAEICKRWKLNESLYTAIKYGLNSEALLPLLLCLTPNLVSLDVGDVGHDMISDEYGHTIHDAVRIYNHCMGGTETASVPEYPSAFDESSLKEWFKSGGARYTPRGRVSEPISSIPWIYSAFVPDSWPAGLSNLKEFSHGGSNSNALRYRPRSLNFWPNQNLPLILQLPSLETLKLTHINALMGAPIEWIGPKPAHKLKRLELYHYRFYRMDFETVARLTGGHLESVVCVLSDENFTPWDMSPQEKIRVITDYFQENSKDTLERDKISVTRSYKGFFDNFQFIGAEHLALSRQIAPNVGTGADEYSECDLFNGVSEDEEDEEENAEEDGGEDGEDYNGDDGNGGRNVNGRRNTGRNEGVI